MICRAEAAERWLRIALEGGLPRTHLQLSRLDFDTGREEEALAHLKLYLAWCVKGARGVCEGCGQVRGEDAQMLTCGGELSLLRHCCLHLCCACAQMLTCSLLFDTRKGCGVARFCSVECQKMASHIGTEGVAFGSERHKDICGLLKKWRQVEKGREAADSCTADMLTFLRL